MIEIIKRDAYVILKDAILSRGLKQKYVAENIGISTNYLGQILNGNKRMSADVLIRASKFLDLPIEIFLK